MITLDSEQTLIKLENVTKIFYTDEVETHALSGIHLDINKGEYVSIAGPSGCGKSTLLSIIGLLDPPTDGSYTLNDHPFLPQVLACDYHALPPGCGAYELWSGAQVGSCQCAGALKPI